MTADGASLVPLEGSNAARLAKEMLAGQLKGAISANQVVEANCACSIIGGHGDARQIAQDALREGGGLRVVQIESLLKNALHKR